MIQKIITLMYVQIMMVIPVMTVHLVAMTHQMMVGIMILMLPVMQVIPMMITMAH